MPNYLNPNVVTKSFDRLGSEENRGKTHLERTSAVLYFLAFDAVCKLLDVSILDLDPDKLDGKNTRKRFELEFTKLVLLGNDAGTHIQFLEFGKFDTTSSNPEKRVSANFLTVPLKKATTQTDSYYYPRRPKAPLLKLGPIATKKSWGVARHDDFEQNLFIILSTAKSSTPAYDLSILVLRNDGFPDHIDDDYLALYDQLDKRFTQDLASLLKKRIERERLILQQNMPMFVSQFTSFVKTKSTKTDPSQLYQKMSKEELIAKVLELEAELINLRPSN
jgi:hypothetical protein